MRSRNEEVPIAVEIQQTQEQLTIYEGISRALREPHTVLDAVLEADDADAARSLLQERLGLDELQAMAVLDMQFRRATDGDRRKIEGHREELTNHLSFLRDLEG